ncbi:MAG: phenylalanine--tRNA ligase subunit beta [Thiobacillaceae bacterium]|jgi:phenylalanyl-tRNA synthetase beta chain|nr:phenylalanine--tRNA ligase subunit beta [Thiobacillaceae bacterium]
MQFSERWLRSLVDPGLAAAELGHLVTMAGLEVEAMEPVAPVFSQVVVAEILSAERHPDADRLQVCRVRADESDPLQVVCGAPNARAGLKTACALVGAMLPGIEIRQAKVRGVVSSGMLCSARELGINGDAEGILELPSDAPVGMDLRDYLHLDDRLITLKLTPNRGDCLSMRGIAREVAALTQAPLQPIELAEVAAAIGDRHEIVVEAPEACLRYCGRVIRGIDPGARTPDWMAERLTRAGLRCIHPVVDVTNYVLLELGEPMHAFDLARLRGPLRARTARPGERLALLNEQAIDLADDCLVIADDDGPLALAGIMGGAASAVSEGTRDIFLEAAHFTPAAIAGRARRFGLSTDSSHRFERGVDPELPRVAMDRATRLILDICGGEAGVVIEAGPGVAPRAPIGFRPERARRVLGVAIGDAEMAGLLTRLGLRVEAASEAWRVTPPTWRFDLNLEVDLIEEVARLRGYESIPAAAPRAGAVMLADEERTRPDDRLKNTIASMGYQEVVTYSFISAELQDDFSGGAPPISLRNPIASQLGVMRGSLMPGLVLTLRHNLNHGQERLRLFELGRCFEGVEADRQPVRLAGLAYGAAWPEQWGTATRAADFHDVKGDVEALLWPLRAEFRAEQHPALHPGQCAGIRVNRRRVGWLGSLHPRLSQKHGFSRNPILFELALDALTDRLLPGYQGVSRFPAVRRDIAVVVDASQVVGELIDAVRSVLPEHMTEFELFDVYQGQGMEPDKKSLAFRMLLQHTEKTLTESEIEAAVSRVLAFLSERYNAVLRG